MRLLCLFSCLFKFLFALKVGFNYSYSVPENAFYKYDLLVINPNVKTIPTFSKLIAYISIGEQINPPNKKWVIGKNRYWKSYIMDIRNKEYQDYLIAKMKKLKYFDGFFFDTLDSYQNTSVNKKEYKKALIKFLKRVKKEFPNKIIIFNRGFDLIDYVKPDIIVMENLLYIHGKKVPQKEFKWLLYNLNRAKEKGIEVVVIEYMKHFNISQAKKIAKKLKDLGFNPYIADPFLKKVGIASY